MGADELRMSSRREILSSVMVLAGTAGTLRANGTPAQGTNPSAGTRYPLSAAEAASKVVPSAYQYAPGDVRRYGLVANRSDAATANARALKALVAPAGAFVGTIVFPNETGADVYHFDDVIPFHDGTHIDLQSSTLEFSKPPTATDTNSGFIFALRNFSIENGSVVVNYDMGKVATSAGSAIHIGNRGADSSHFAPTYDSTLQSPMGNIVIRNVRITSNVANGNAIEMTGGLVNVAIENVWIDGQAALSGGIYYEFGWATSGPTELRQTSHAHNMRFSNINITNLKKSTGAAITLAGAYNCLIDGLYVNGAAAAFSGTPGESLFYRPWAGVDQVGAKRTIALRNVVAQGIADTALWFTGAQLAAHGYLAKRNLTAVDQTDLGDYSLDGFALNGGGGGWGIFTSAAKADIRNGRISGFQRGVVQSDDCTRLLVNAVDVFSCAQFAMQLGLGGAIWDPPRQKLGEIRNCFIAGNSTEAVGRYGAILLDNCAGFLIENNRIGHELIHDGAAEGTQGNAIQLGQHCANVICRDNYVGGVRDGCVAYYNNSTSDARGNSIQSPGGVMTTRGSWDGTTVKRRAVAFTTSITIDATGSEQYDITATSNADFSIEAPVNPVADKTITLTIHNASGGALGNAMWNGIFRMSPWTNPADGHNRSIVLRYDGVQWVQIVQVGVDVPNAVSI
jgi:hypothetical protein